MLMVSSPRSVEQTEEFYHVRFRDPDEFDTIRTPDWAKSPAESIVEGSEVRTGHREANDDWVVQSVLVPIGAADSEDLASDLAEDIASKIES